MSDTSLATTEPTQRQIGRREASAPGRVTGRLKRTIDLMAFEPMTDSEACAQTGMRLTALRIAMRQTHVLAYWRAQLQVLRARESARNIHRLTEIRDAANNMPAVQAIKLLEQIPDENASASKGLMPGFVVQILNVQSPAVMERDGGNDAKPLIEHKDVRNE